MNLIRNLLDRLALGVLAACVVVGFHYFGGFRCSSVNSC